MLTVVCLRDNSHQGLHRGANGARQYTGWSHRRPDEVSSSKHMDRYIPCRRPSQMAKDVKSVAETINRVRDQDDGEHASKHVKQTGS